jgi:RES domain-containing protein
VVYASGSLALAAIETFVHLGEDAVHIRFVYFRIDIPDDVAAERCRRPPAGWRAEPPEDSSMRYGSAWIRRRRTAVLEVPSVIVPSEKNYLLDPHHPDFARLRVSRPARFVFDPRMWK